MGVTLRFRTLKNGKRSYYLDIIKDKKRYTEFLKIYVDSRDPNRSEKINQAKKLQAQRLIEIESKNNSEEISPANSFNKSFFDYYDDFVENCPNKNIRMFEKSYRHFKIFHKKKDLKFKDLTNKLIENFSIYLQKEAKLSGETPSNYLAKFKQVIRKAYREDYLPKMIGEDVRISYKSKRLKKAVLELEEIQELYRTPCGNNEVKNAFIFACFTGIGYAEAVEIEFSHIMNNRLHYTRKKTDELVIVPLHKICIDIINEIDTKRQFLFELPSIVSVNKNLKNWVKRTKINKHISFYCGRHSFACLLLSNGANLKTVADCLGHASIAHTAKYLNHVNHLKKGAIDNIPDFDI